MGGDTLTKHCDIAEVPANHHNPRQGHRWPALGAVGDPQRGPTAMGPDSLDVAFSHPSHSSRSAVTEHFQRVVGNGAVQRAIEERSLAEARTSDLAARIDTASGGGWSIGRRARRKLERGLGAELGHVRVHDDGEADALARSVGATAFTTGSDIFFRQGAYQPGSREGLRLLAHEATHVLQQAAGGVDGTARQGVSLSHPSDQHEQAAEANAHRMMAGKTAPTGSETPLRAGSTGSGPAAVSHPTVQRMFDGVGDWLAETAGNVGGAATSLGGSLVEAYSRAAGGAGGALRSGVDRITESGMGVGRALSGGYGAFLGAGGGIADAVLSGGGFEGVLGAVGSGVSQLGEAGGGLWDAVGGYAGAISDAWSGVGGSLAGGATGVGEAAWQGAGDLWGAWSGAATGLGGNVDPSLLTTGVTVSHTRPLDPVRRTWDDDYSNTELAPEDPPPWEPPSRKPLSDEDAWRRVISPRAEEDGPDYNYWSWMIGDAASRAGRPSG